MQRDRNNNAVETQDLNVYYGDFRALKGVNLKIERQNVTAIIGSSGCGKSTMLRSFNRMNELTLTARTEGKVLFMGQNIYDPDVDPVDVRRRVGMVFQKPNPFPKSIYENIAYGPRVQGINNKEKLDKIVETSLKKAVLWDEVSDRLQESAMGLSGGQQQRLCIARSLAIEPEVILMDEPCSALDPIATAKIEDLITLLKKNYTVVIVTHNMQQAARVSDYAAYMYLGKLIEYGDTKQIFENPREELTEKYITGRFG